MPRHGVAVALLASQLRPNMWPYPRLHVKPAGLGTSMTNSIALSDPPQLLKGTTMDPLRWPKIKQFHNWSKHIVIRWHWVRDLVEQQLINIETCGIT